MYSADHSGTWFRERLAPNFILALLTPLAQGETICILPSERHGQVVDEQEPFSIRRVLPSSLACSLVAVQRDVGS